VRAAWSVASKKLWPANDVRPKRLVYLRTSSELPEDGTLPKVPLFTYRQMGLYFSKPIALLDRSQSEKKGIKSRATFLSYRDGRQTGILFAQFER